MSMTVMFLIYNFQNQQLQDLDCIYKIVQFICKEMIVHLLVQKSYC